MNMMIVVVMIVMMMMMMMMMMTMICANTCRPRILILWRSARAYATPPGRRAHTEEA